MNCLEVFSLINRIIVTTFGILFSYKVFFIIVGMFWKRKFPKSKQNHKYGIVIAARNEEKVIGNLIDSIAKQDYPKELITVFVVADNCTDQTATIARNHGAICYERFDKDHRTKGYALQFLFDRIEDDYKRNSFEGFFVFDADNLLMTDYIARMNDAFDSGEKIITSYRNTKNFDDNWVSASYALHWLRSNRFNHIPRSYFHLATNIQGTGFLFASEIVKDGWDYVSLTEDRALTADAVTKGYKISFCNEAEFFDEQPTNLKIAFRQRIRWGKGHLQAFTEKGKQLLVGTFKQKSFACYDIFMQCFPIVIVNFFWGIVYNIVRISFFISLGTFITGTGSILLALIQGIGMTWLTDTLLSSYVIFVERKRIKKMSFFKKLWFVLMCPMFDVIGIIATCIAFFVKVTWKPIPHTSKINIDNLTGNSTNSDDLLEKSIDSNIISNEIVINTETK